LLPLVDDPGDDHAQSHPGDMGDVHIFSGKLSAAAHNQGRAYPLIAPDDGDDHDRLTVWSFLDADIRYSVGHALDLVGSRSLREPLRIKGSAVKTLFQGITEDPALAAQYVDAAIVHGRPQAL